MGHMVMVTCEDCLFSMRFNSELFLMLHHNKDMATSSSVSRVNTLK